MRKGLIAYSALPIIVFLSLFFALTSAPEIDASKYVLVEESVDGVLVEDRNEDTDNEDVDHFECFASPVLGKTYLGFKEALAFKESRGDYFTVNTFGYMGKYQFGAGTLELIGIYDSNSFLTDPEMQEKAFLANTMRNKWVLRRDIKRFVGKRIDGILVTESGILAAAHLAGPGSVKRFLRSYGAVGFTDAFGTSIRYYMKRFSGYDTSTVKADRFAKATLL